MSEAQIIAADIALKPGVPVTPGAAAKPSRLLQFARQLGQQLGQRLLPWLVPVALIAVWQAASAYGWLSTRVLPAPLDVLRAAWALAESGELDPDLPRQAAEKYDLLNVNAGSSGNAGGDA